MTRINVKRFGFACGTTAALVYLGCIIIMLTLSKEDTIAFFNSIMHGLDVSSIIRMEMPLYEMAIGLVQIFILSWLTGATVASVYNLGTGDEG